MLLETSLFKEVMYFSQTYNERDMRCDVPDARCMVRGAWYEVRGARYEAQDTRYVVRGTGYTCWVCWEGTCKDGNDVHNMGASWVRTPLPLRGAGGGCIPLAPIYTRME